MGLLRGFSGWLDSIRRSPGDLVRQDPAAAGSPVKLTFSGRRFKLELEIPGLADPDDAEPISPAAEEIRQARDEARSSPSPPPTPDGIPASPDAIRSLPQQGRDASREPLSQRPATPPFWDALDPTEREALRSVASWRTFAAGARLMEEGERADHVMVILGGRTEIRVAEGGSERVLAVRGLGQLVGERGALQVSVRSATVIALEMVWALVVQTKDFAAFISAHPRVLDIVLSQQNQRGTEGPAGNCIAGRQRKHPRLLNGENCTVFLTDVVEFGARTRTDGDRLLIREALFRMTQAVTQGMPGAQSEDRGDGFLTVVPPDVATASVLGRLMKELPAALELYNSTQRESARFKLRLAVNVGPVVSDMGVTGEAIIVAARLVEAPRFKAAIAGSTASMGVIASPFVYEAVIRHGTDPREVASYSQVPVEVKESATTAWMKLFDAPVPSPLAVRPAAHEPYLGPLMCRRSSLGHGHHGESRGSIRDKVSLRLGSEVRSRAPGRVSQRSWACSFSGWIASGAWVAMKNRTSACWCAGSPLPGGTSTMTTCLISASGHGARSVRPVSSSASRNTMARGSVSPGSP
jgi:Cyclic nucleotide-binding domain